MAFPTNENNYPCFALPDRGPCNQVLYKWAFDQNLKSCVMFEWSGCGGNNFNRFNTETECLKTCAFFKAQSLTSNVSTISNASRGPMLTFQETGNGNTFMFAQSNTFIQIDGDIIQTFQLRLCRQISFQFRTRLPHGLLAYHNVKVPAGISLQPYALYIIVQQGQLKVVHVYGKHSTALTVGRGLNRDEWHSVTVRIDVHSARLAASVDGIKEETDLKGLDKESNYGVSANVTSVILIGGLSSEERLHGVKYIIESFVGCIKDVILSSGKSASDLLPISPLIATKHENVQEGCINKCYSYENLCFRSSRCINHYNTLTCDCFGSKYEGEYCDMYGATILTLRGSSYVSYRVYDWKDRVHSAVNRFSMLFKTRFDDAALFHAAGGETGIDHYIAASLFNDTVYVEGNPLLYIDPEIYIGGGPELQKKKGILEPEFYEADVTKIPITFPFSSSHIWWPNNRTDSLSLSFHFKSSTNLSVLASSESQAGLYWEIRVVNDEVRFELSDSNKNITHLISVKKTPGIWHILKLTYRNEEVILRVDHQEKQEKLGSLKFAIGDKIKAASGSRTNSGLVGCMRDIIINDDELEPRAILQSERTVGEVTLDNCQFVNPCLRPNTCEHGGKCSIKDDRLICDCKETGYIGKNCHFTKYRKTCEELALLGYTKPDVYLIDIDGNGRFPPAHVRCEFQSLEDATKTIVEHNLQSQTDVRTATDDDFSLSIKYREFTADMLQELVSHSLNCSQYIRYDCLKAPLELHTSTWFISSANQTVDYIGEVKRGTCPCSLEKNCNKPSHWCNCDDPDQDKWGTDDGYYTNANSLGITEMIFLQQSYLTSDALGRITLGPLECVETNTQRYVVTFTTSQSYIEVPGWRKGDLAFSFRTTGEKAILLYQPPIRPNYPSFMVAVTSDFQLTFNFTLNTGVSKEIVIISERKLNGGEWHKLWIDYNKYHVRFMINEESQMENLKPEEEFGPFEGSMFIGGAPFELLDAKSSVQQGLIGCFRGLVVNEEILDIYSYMSVHLSEIIKDCKPSCNPNPCLNQAQCKELWRHLCETNINTNALTFVNPDSVVRINYLNKDDKDSKDVDELALRNIFTHQLLLNLRTYDNTALILYANDHLNNFIHLYIENGTQVVYLFNYNNTIHNVTVNYSELNTSRSVQIAVEREENQTTVHVNDKNNSIPVGILLLKQYSNKPWRNPDKEVLAPQRPIAPPTEYFQLNLGGFDPETLLKVSNNPLKLPGYVGCMRGLQIGDNLIDLVSKIDVNESGVITNCTMKCDSIPCQNGGICIEDFRNQEHTCECEHTSYYGEYCSDEKGADFSGDSILWREYVLNGSVDHVKVQLAFSSMDNNRKYAALLLLQTENNRSYYLLVALSPEGYLIFQEDREGEVYSATVQSKNFINGARHSIYYKRNLDQYELLVDKEMITMEQVAPQSFTNVPELGANDVQIGGHNTSDPRFATFKRYSGCLSNIVIEVNEHVMKPLEEYMLFTKTGAEKVNVSNSQGVRSAQCSPNFDDYHEKLPGTPNMNISQGKDKTWVEDAPHKVLYNSLYSAETAEEEDTGKMIVIVLSIFFVVVLICVSYELYRTDRKYKIRKEYETDAGILWSKEQAAILQETNRKASGDNEDVQLKPSNGKIPNHTTNGISKIDDNDKKNVVVPIIVEIPPEETPVRVLKRADSKKEKRISFRDSASELAWDTPEESEGLLKTMVEEDEEAVESDEEELKHSKCCEALNFTSYQQSEDNKDDHVKQSKKVKGIASAIRPILFNGFIRKFNNPISYLGGPILPSRSRTSLDTVLSID
ncbi:hypothetical protein WA026_022286 [Henosepilachna vigintioctopunctata]|uniref:Uncharacterized protein n=1 Tax=Henosepilachna vigintioctopunctata TaxID=420089 RepID=A0AAW1VGT0_9CUCU